MKTAQIKLPLLVLITASLAPVLQAATIQWGGAISDSFYLSDGTATTEASAPSLNITFALGSFDSGFEPSEDNLSEWSTNWRPLQETSYSLENQYFTEELTLVDTDVATAGIQFNGSTFTPGENVYIWGYNQQTVDENLEWVLMLGISGADTGGVVADPTNTNWEIPDIAQNNQGTFPLNYRTSTSNTTPFGSVGGETGGGLIETPTVGNLQFATIPEPSAWLLVALATFGFVGIRRR